jgi:hypothetical protein
VSAAFLEAVLLQEPYRSALPRQGVRIVGAWFEEALALEDARLRSPLWLDRSRFEREVQLSNLRSMDSLSLEGSYFAQSLSASRAQLGGWLNLSGAHCTGTLNLNELEVKAGLSMNTAGAQTAQFAEVILRGARIGGQLELSGARCTGRLDLESLQVTRHVFLDNAVVDGNITLIFARLRGNLRLDRAQVASLDLTGATLQGELRLSEVDENKPQWAEGAQLILRNATIGALQCPPSLDSWPTLELSGCSYKQLGRFSSADSALEMAARARDWFVD